jgi:hypothetical protein
VFEPFRSFHQPYHPVPLYSIERKSNVIPIKHSLQTFHRSLRVPAVFSEDAPGVLNGTNDGILVGVIHNGSRNSTKPRFKIEEEFSFPFGAAVLCLGGYRDQLRVLSPAASDSLSPRG